MCVYACIYIHSYIFSFIFLFLPCGSGSYLQQPHFSFLFFSSPWHLLFPSLTLLFPSFTLLFLSLTLLSNVSGCFGVRHLVAFLGFLGFANVYAMRVNLSVAIVAMVNNSAIPHANASTVGVCPLPNTNTSSPQKVCYGHSFLLLE